MIDTGVETAVCRNLLRYAVGRAITCPSCGDILDAARAAFVSSPSHSWVGCARCHGQGAHTWRDGEWMVLDGRTLFAKPPRRKRARKGGK